MFNLVGKKRRKKVKVYIVVVNNLCSVVLESKNMIVSQGLGFRLSLKGHRLSS
jgi:hypothetical protein